MTNEEYIAELRRRLRALPEDDARDAIEYYENYLSDAGDDAQGAIASLGSPAELAATVLAEYAVKEPPQENISGENDSPPKYTPYTPKSDFKIAWAIILAVFAAPIALPLAIAVVAVALSLLVSLVAVVISFGAAGLGLIIGGVLYFFAGFTFFGEGVGAVLMYIGSGLFAVGVGSLMLWATVALSKYGVGGIIKLVGKIILRRKSK